MMSWIRHLTSSAPSYTRLDDGRAENVLAAMAEHTYRLSSHSVDRDDAESGDEENGGIPMAEKAAWRTRRRRPILGRTLAGITLLSVGMVAGFIIFSGFSPRYEDLEDWASTAVSWFEGDDGTLVIENDPTHVLVPILSAPRHTKLLQPMATRPPLDALVEYYSTGSLPSVHFPSRQMDLVYMFVNASSPYFQAAKAAKLKTISSTLDKGKDRHWRDNGELRGALRSGALSLKGRLGRIHVVSAAFDFNETADIDLPDNLNGDTILGWRLGQIPDYVDWENKANLQWSFHPDIFQLPRDEDGKLPPAIASLDEEAWRREALPTFNSFEIESRVGWIDGLAEELILSNDDMFFLRELAHGDFHHPLYGTVFRLEPGLEVAPLVTAKQQTDSGEWGGLGYASELLSKRFPHRSRAYMHHMPKAVKKSLLHEASVMFAAELSEAATRPFREAKVGHADVEMPWLATHLQIERWREALLWTWAMARVADVNGKWGSVAREELRLLFGVWKGSEKGADVTISTSKESRKTIPDMEEMSARGGWEVPIASTILYSSFDGHMSAAPYSSEEWKLKAKIEKNPYNRKLKLRPPPPSQCNFNFDKCLPTGFFDDEDAEFDAAEMFKRLTFEEYRCGDCLIDALVLASGERGLDAFLPAADKLFSPHERESQMWERPEPILPLTGTWQESDFSLAANVRWGQDEWARIDRKDSSEQVNLRDWSVKLLSRYAYVYAVTPSRFAMVHSSIQMHNAVKFLTEDKSLALACINDDQPDGAGNLVRVQFQKWFQQAFGHESKFIQWEKNATWDLVE